MTPLSSPTPCVHLSSPTPLSQPWSRDRRWGAEKGHSALWLTPQLGAGMNKNPAAFSIGPLTSLCNYDWWAQFSGFTSVLVTFPKWVMHIVKAGLNQPVHIRAEYINTPPDGQHSPMDLRRRHEHSRAPLTGNLTVKSARWKNATVQVR